MLKFSFRNHLPDPLRIAEVPFPGPLSCSQFIEIIAFIAVNTLVVRYLHQIANDIDKRKLK